MRAINYKTEYKKLLTPLMLDKIVTAMDGIYEQMAQVINKSLAIVPVI